MLQVNRELLNKKFLRRKELLERPELADFLICKKCVIRVLVVIDGLSFADVDFGLTDFIDIIKTSSNPAARIEVSRAHRESSNATTLNGADKDFVFSDSSLTNIDVVFLFGVNRTGNLPLPPSELKALATFMDNGGGVFATGDHEDLGQAMCGGLLRVRSMRKWYWDSSEDYGVPVGPFDEPNAPPGGNAERHDTNRPGHNGTFSFDDQSDDIPQVIKPIYKTVAFARFRNILEPHPVLCGNNGVIKLLPDHPHEGECITPWETDRTFNYDGVDFDEYPTNSSGGQPLPEVIATSTMLAGAEAPAYFKPPIAGGTFGAISTYDGHNANVGRVLCDATWHHFINVNLTGTADVPASNPKSIGFLASEEGEEKFEEIKNYFRNIIVWLAPEDKQTCMKNAWIWNVIRQPAFVEEFGGLVAKKKLDLDIYRDIGRFVSLYPTPDLSKCQKSRWRIDFVLPELRVLPELECLFDCRAPKPGGLPGRPGPRPDPLPFGLETDVIVDAAVGRVAFEMLKESQNLQSNKALEPPKSSTLLKMSQKASKSALVEMAKEMTKDLKQTSSLINKLTKL